MAVIGLGALICVQVLPALVVSSTTAAGVDAVFRPMAKQVVVLGQEMFESELVSKLVLVLVMMVGPDQVDPLIETKVPLLLASPEAKQTVVEGHEIPVVANPSCWTAHDPALALVNLV